MLFMSLSTVACNGPRRLLRSVVFIPIILRSPLGTGVITNSVICVGSWINDGSLSTGINW